MHSNILAKFGCWKKMHIGNKKCMKGKKEEMPKEERISPTSVTSSINDLFLV